MNSDEIFINRCLQLAKLGKGNVSPNPMVGCVIVHDDIIIGEGYHQKYGEPHAEVNAINSVVDKKLLKHSTIYVSLEPCAHYGKTPPCANLIVNNNIPKVVIGCSDSFDKVNGKGVGILKKAGIDVKINILEKESKKLNKRFFTFHNKKRPYIILKWAESKDKYIAKYDDDRNKVKTNISNKLSKQHVHYSRSTEDAILVGKNTILIDNPSLTTRLVDGKSPIRIILDRNLETLNKDFTVYTDKKVETLVFNYLTNKKDFNVELIKIYPSNELKQVLDILYKRNIQSLIIEGGTQILNSFLNENLWDEAQIYKSKLKLNKGVNSPNFKNKKLLNNITLEDNVLEIYENER